MIYELRTYTVEQGTAAEMAKHAGTVGRDIRGDNYGKLEGYWVSDIGHLNQLMHLWSYSDLNERARLRAELGKNKRWTSEYIPVTRPNLIRQEVRLLNPVIAPKVPAATPNVYELRAYRTRPGASPGGSDTRGHPLAGYTASFRSLAARKATFLLALILIGSPVAGLRPMRAGRLRTCRTPSPPIRMRAPRFKCLVTVTTMSSSI